MIAAYLLIGDVLHQCRAASVGIRCWRTLLSIDFRRVFVAQGRDDILANISLDAAHDKLVIAPHIPKVANIARKQILSTKVVALTAGVKRCQSRMWCSDKMFR